MNNLNPVYLMEGWFFKSDEEVGTENIRSRNPRVLYEDINLFIKIWTELFFLDIWITEYYKQFYDNVVKYHWASKKKKTEEEHLFTDFDAVGQRILSYAIGLIKFYEEGHAKKLNEKLRKHLIRWEPDVVKDFYYSSGLSDCYAGVVDYFKKNKLTALLNQINNQIENTGLMKELNEIKSDVKFKANDLGYKLSIVRKSEKDLKAMDTEFTPTSIKSTKNAFPKSLLNTAKMKKFKS